MDIEELHTRLSDQDVDCRLVEGRLIVPGYGQVERGLRGWHVGNGFSSEEISEDDLLDDLEDVVDMVDSLD